MLMQIARNAMRKSLKVASVSVLHMACAESSRSLQFKDTLKQYVHYNYSLRTSSIFADRLFK